MDQVAGRCNVTYFKDAMARIEAGSAASLHDASRQIAEETGETQRAAATRIYRGKKDVARLAQPEPQPPETDANQDFAAKSNDLPEIKRPPAKDGTMRGGQRSNAGRKPKPEQPKIGWTDEDTSRVNGPAPTPRFFVALQF
jgi:hypothetical protein